MGLIGTGAANDHNQKFNSLVLAVQLIHQDCSSDLAVAELWVTCTMFLLHLSFLSVYLY